MLRPKIEEETILKTVTIFESDYNTLTLIGKKNDLTGDGGKISMREVVRFLITNYGDKIA
jgi:hypothetical protein